MLLCGPSAFINRLTARTVTPLILLLVPVPASFLTTVPLLILTPLTLLTMTSLLPLPLSPLILIRVTKNPVTSSPHPLMRRLNRLQPGRKRNTTAVQLFKRLLLPGSHITTSDTLNHSLARRKLMMMPLSLGTKVGEPFLLSRL